jgi:hypothetical protein
MLLTAHPCAGNVCMGSCAIDQKTVERRIFWIMMLQTFDKVPVRRLGRNKVHFSVSGSRRSHRSPALYFNGFPETSVASETSFKPESHPAHTLCM